MTGAYFNCIACQQHLKKKEPAAGTTVRGIGWGWGVLMESGLSQVHGTVLKGP